MRIFTMKRLLAGLALVALGGAGCRALEPDPGVGDGIAEKDSRQYPGAVMSSPKTPKPERSFVAGPPLADSTALLEWLDANPRAYLRLPVVIFPGDLGGIRLAFIGTEPAPPPEGAILLDLDDTTLGIPLSSRLRSLCGAGGAPCAVWIEGTWGRPLPGLGASEPPPWPVTVRDAGPAVEGSPATIRVAR